MDVINYKKPKINLIIIIIIIIISTKETDLINKKCLTKETTVQNIKNQFQSNTDNEKTEEFKRKPVLGQFYRDLERPNVDKEKSLACVCISGLKIETESLIKQPKIKHSVRFIIRGTKKTDSQCMMCDKTEEHIKHIVAGCKTFSSSEYTNRNSKVTCYIHWTICQLMGLQGTEKCYEEKYVEVS